MSVFQKLLSDTTPQRDAFIAIPLIQEVLKSGAQRANEVADKVMARVRAAVGL